MKKTWKRIRAFMDLDGPSHSPVVSMPGLSIKHTKRTETAIWAWVPLIGVLVAAIGLLAGVLLQ